MNVLPAILITSLILAAVVALILSIKYLAARKRFIHLAIALQAIADAPPGAVPLPAHGAGNLSRILGPLVARLGLLETDLAEKREIYTTLLASISAGVVIVGYDRRVLSVSEKVKQLFPSAAADQPFIDLTRDYEMDAIVSRCLEKKQPQMEVVRPLGGERYLELTAAPLRRGALVLILDLTSVRRLEKIRQDFIANVSHELRTPIASCKAMVETLEDGAVKDRSVARDFLKRMHVEVDKLAQMVNELGELSRIESGELPLSLSAVDLDQLLRRVTDRLRAQADRAGLKITLDIPPGLPPAAADEHHIEQVAVNLVHNAIKFTPAGGRIVVSAGVENSRLRVSVADSGIGIPRDELDRIFERFYKVDKARSGAGTGLGLAIARHIVQAHGGSIRVESEAGRGATFTFDLTIAGS